MQLLCLCNNYSGNVAHAWVAKAAMETAPVSPAGAWMYCKWLFRSELEGTS